MNSTIKISIPGVQITNDQKNSVTEMDYDSISKFKKKTRTVNNTLCPPGLASYLAKRDIKEYAWPKTNLDITVGYLAAFMEILNGGFVVDSRLFPQLEDYQFDGFIREISFDLKNKTTKIKLRAKTTYAKNTV